MLLSSKSLLTSALGQHFSPISRHIPPPPPSLRCQLRGRLGPLEGNETNGASVNTGQWARNDVFAE
jgi:hypothetical protein